MSLRDTPTRHHSSVQVICLGLSRTGTTSLSAALDILGFGPCYHTFRLQAEYGKKLELRPWIEMAQKGTATLESLDQILNGYCSVLDEPAALFPEALYNAYPNSKFILTIRDPEKWESSMQETLFPAIDLRLKAEPESKVDEWVDWCNCKVKKLQPGILSDPKTVLLRHNEHVKSVIPSEKLLVFDVTDGWQKLVEFLGVAKPALPFPYLNDRENYKRVILQPLVG